jgi:imidazoleglycerol-phosphate dehydratase/histidinol-phosphatase
VSLKKYLFLEGEIALSSAPEKLELLPDVIPSALKLQSAGYRLILVSAQPTESLAKLLLSQGVRLEKADPRDCLAPRFLDGEIDRDRSFVLGVESGLARELGLATVRLGEGWKRLATELVSQPRRGRVQRLTLETQVDAMVFLDEPERTRIHTGIGFYDHMLEQIARHAGIGLEVTVQGDLKVDEHHTVEDTALTLGKAMRQALGDKIGIGRYGFLLPMDEAEATVSLDLSGRPYLVFEGKFPRDRVGEFPTELVAHFFRSFSEALGATLHVSVKGENTHHMVESTFKGLGRCLRQAVAFSGSDLPSTKGAL